MAMAEELGVAVSVAARVAEAVLAFGIAGQPAVIKKILGCTYREKVLNKQKAKRHAVSRSKTTRQTIVERNFNDNGGSILTMKAAARHASNRMQHLVRAYSSIRMPKKE